MSALAVRNLTKMFGGVAALSGVFLSVERGERRALIGPNGAGKTTLFHSIAGTHLPSSGSVTLFEQDITWLPSHARARAGLARTFQITNLFPRLTVRENLLLAVAAASDIGPSLIKPMSAYPRLFERGQQLLTEWGLAERSDGHVASLSYGEQRQLELAMALAGSPKVLLLDEPTAGLSADESKRVVLRIRELPRDMTILMIEHDMDVAFELADTISVLHQGRVIAEGDQHAIRANPHVTEIYLGAE